MCIQQICFLGSGPSGLDDDVPVSEVHLDPFPQLFPRSGNLEGLDGLKSAGSHPARRRSPMPTGVYLAKTELMIDFVPD
jgi:hypothetical protein